MPRHISFALTTPQFLDGSKDVTRRMGWANLKAGDVLIAVEKSQGLGKGGKVKKLGTIEVISARCEPLRRMIDEPAYGAIETRREGFPPPRPKSEPLAFVDFFCRTHKGCAPESIVTRIEFRRLDCPLGLPASGPWERMLVLPQSHAFLKMPPDELRRLVGPNVEVTVAEPIGHN